MIKTGFWQCVFGYWHIWNEPYANEKNNEFHFFMEIPIIKIKLEAILFGFQHKHI